jgi:hypothetical protein
MFATFVLDGSTPRPIPSASLEEALMIQDSLLETARRPGSPSYQRILGLQAFAPDFTGQVLVVKVPNVDSPQALHAAIFAGHPVVPVVGKPILPPAEIPTPVAGHAA